MGLRMHREGERVGSGEREFVLPFFCFLTAVFSWVTISYITGLRVLIVLVRGLLKIHIRQVRNPGPGLSVCREG